MATRKPKKKLLEQLKLDGLWDNLSPNHRRGAVVVLALSGLFVFMAAITRENTAPVKTTRNAVKRSVLTDVDTRSIGIEALNAKVSAMENENRKLLNELSSVKQELTDVQRRRGNDPDMSREMDQLRAQLQNLTDTAKTLGWEVEDIKGGYYTFDPKPIAQPTPSPKDTSAEPAEPKPAEPKPATAVRPAPVEEDTADDPNRFFKTPPVRPVNTSPLLNTGKVGPSVPTESGLSIFTVEQEGLAEETVQEEELFLPAGSIISGVLLNGLDAATGRAARQDPFPVLVRIQKDAILPNQFNADVKECFVTMAGYGELSAERAYLRGETFSCVTRDGDVIEEAFPAYAVGEDGKAGLRGRLVSKAGSLLAKTAMAGFAAGVSQAFGSSPVPVVQTGADGTASYQSNFTTGAAQHGVSTGASAAMTRLADYYMELADQMFPVIEVDGGRRIDVVLTHGFRLKVKANQSIRLGRNEP